MTEPTAEPAATADSIQVQILHVADCPHVDGLRDLLRRCIEQSGTSVSVDEIEGAFPSPTLLINGVDVTGRPTGDAPSCRLDLPSADEILAALTAAVAGRAQQLAHPAL